MSELIFISNKARKDIIKYTYVIIIAVITWILQVSIFSRYLYFDTSTSILILGCIFFGLSLGPLAGVLFGICSSFFSSSILYDHIFYFSYPLIGLIAGFLTKNLFSSEFLFFILLSFFLTLPIELLNGWQYNLLYQLNIFDRYLLTGLSSASLNLVISPFYYFFMKFITKKLNLK